MHLSWRLSEAGAAVQLFARNIHEQTPCLVITDRARHTVFGSGADPFEVISGLVPFEAATRGGDNSGGPTHASGERRVIDTVDGRLFGVGDHHLVAEHIDRLESEELALRLIDDPDPRFSDGARAAAAA